MNQKFFSIIIKYIAIILIVFSCSSQVGSGDSGGGGGGGGSISDGSGDSGGGTSGGGTNSDDNNLFNLTVSTGTLTPAFDSTILNYTISVPYTTKNMTVTPTQNAINATIKVNGTSVISGHASGSINIVSGLNTINIVVTAQDGTDKTYTIDVTRQPWMLADFNGVTPGDLFVNNVNSDWWTGDDNANGGNSSEIFSIGGSPVTGSWAFGYYYRLGNTWGTGKPPYVFIATGLASNNENNDVDLTSFNGIKLYIRSGVCTKQRVELVSSNISDWDYYGINFDIIADGNWHLYTLPFSSFTKRGFGTNTETIENSLIHGRVLQIYANSGIVGESDTVYLDDIQIY